MSAYLSTVKCSLNIQWHKNTGVSPRFYCSFPPQLQYLAKIVLFLCQQEYTHIAIFLLRGYMLFTKNIEISENKLERTNLPLCINWVLLYFPPPNREEVWRERPVSFSTRPLCGARKQCVSVTVPSSSHLAGHSCPTWAEWRASGSRGAPAWWSGSSGSTTQRRLAWGSDTEMARWRLTAVRIYETGRVTIMLHAFFLENYYHDAPFIPSSHLI